jgi:hypothetical protein
VRDENGGKMDGTFDPKRFWIVMVVLALVFLVIVGCIALSTRHSVQADNEPSYLEEFVEVAGVDYNDPTPDRQWVWWPYAVLGGIGVAFLIFSGAMIGVASRHGELVRAVQTSTVSGTTGPSAARVSAPSERSREQDKPVKVVPVIAQPPSSSVPLVADEITKLAKLREDGLITPEEFEAQKSLLLRQGG